MMPVDPYTCPPMKHAQLTVAKECIIHQWEAQSDGEKIEEVVIPCDYDKHLKKHLSNKRAQIHHRNSSDM